MPRPPVAASAGAGAAAQADDDSGLDECFFVLQRCSQRAVATNNVQAASAVLHLVTDLLTSDLAGKYIRTGLEVAFRLEILGIHCCV